MKNDLKLSPADLYRTVKNDKSQEGLIMYLQAQADYMLIHSGLKGDRLHTLHGEAGDITVVQTLYPHSSMQKGTISVRAKYENPLSDHCIMEYLRPIPHCSVDQETMLNTVVKKHVELTKGDIPDIINAGTIFSNDHLHLHVHAGLDINQEDALQIAKFLGNLEKITLSYLSQV